MILSGREIERAVGTDIIIEPFERSKVNPNSYNLTLHNELLVYENEILDMKKPNPTKKLVIPEEGLLLEPNKLYLGRTKEFTTTRVPPGGTENRRGPDRRADGRFTAALRRAGKQNHS